MNERIQRMKRMRVKDTLHYNRKYVLTSVVSPLFLSTYMECVKRISAILAVQQNT